jgi:hypothetical protein
VFHSWVGLATKSLTKSGSLKGASLRLAPALPTHIILGWTGNPMTKTLAYLAICKLQTYFFIKLAPGANVIKLLLSVIYKCSKQARMFVKPLQPSQIFVSKARSLPYYKNLYLTSVKSFQHLPQIGSSIRIRSPNSTPTRSRCVRTPGTTSSAPSSPTSPASLRLARPWPHSLQQTPSGKNYILVVLVPGNGRDLPM